MAFRLWFGSDRRFRKGPRDKFRANLGLDTFRKPVLTLSSSGTVENPSGRDREGEVSVEIAAGNLDDTLVALALSEHYGWAFKPEVVAGMRREHERKVFWEANNA